MRVVHLSAHDLGGGAGRAAYRLHDGLVRIGVDSLMLVRDRTSGATTVVEQGSAARRVWARNRAYVDQALPLAYPRRERGQYFTAGLLPDAMAADVRALRPDVVNVHWVGEGFVNPRTLPRLGAPIVWTLHDAWPFTGGCHYPGDCERFADRCGACPVLGSSRARDLSRLVWWRKRRAWRSLDLSVVTPSRWLAECARKSALFADRPVHVVPNAVDIDVFRPLPRDVARSVLRLPANGRLVLFVAAGGAANPIKGFRFLADALRALAGSGRADGVALVVAGARTVPDAAAVGVPVHCTGQLSDETSLALLYSAADVAVVPSVQENFANTGLEALACGTPVIAFRVGGMPDMVRDRVNGVLVEPFDAAALADAIRWTLEDRARLEGLSRAARDIAEREYALGVQARAYVDEYGAVLGASGARAVNRSGAQ